jgi:uncharacterized protein (TIGR00297 family)
MTSLESLLLVLLLCGLLAVLSYRLGLLTPSGSLASFAVGVLIGYLGSITWLVLLIVFALSGFVVTKYKFELKARNGLQEGKKGERTYKNVIANGLVPTAIAVVFFAAGEQSSPLANLTYLCAISVAASDTIASELGVLSPKVRLITTMRPVPPGTNGGISAFGTLWAFLGAIFASILGWMVLFPGALPDLRIFVPVIFGFLGCNIDSLIGATWETKGHVDKLGTNILSMLIGSLLGYVMLIWLF